MTDVSVVLFCFCLCVCSCVIIAVISSICRSLDHPLRNVYLHFSQRRFLVERSKPSGLAVSGLFDEQLPAAGINRRSSGDVAICLSVWSQMLRRSTARRRCSLSSHCYLMRTARRYTACCSFSTDSPTTPLKTRFNVLLHHRVIRTLFIACPSREGS